jgi:hypothetical protein
MVKVDLYFAQTNNQEMDISWLSVRMMISTFLFILRTTITYYFIHGWG